MCAVWVVRSFAVAFLGLGEQLLSLRDLLLLRLEQFEQQRKDRDHGSTLCSRGVVCHFCSAKSLKFSWSDDGFCSAKFDDSINSLSLFLSVFAPAVTVAPSITGRAEDRRYFYLQIVGVKPKVKDKTIYHRDTIAGKRISPQSQIFAPGK